MANNPTVELQITPTEFNVDMSDKIQVIDQGQARIDSIVDGSVVDLYSEALSVRQYAFYSCTSLETVELPKATRFLGSGSQFIQCANLKSVNAPELQSINGNSAFQNCTKLTDVNMPKLTTLPQNTFGWCSNLENISLPLLERIVTQAFYSCTKLSSVDLPALASIGNNCFGLCHALISVRFPSARYIDAGAFTLCNNLEVVDLGGTEQGTTYQMRINGGAFSQCPKLHTLILRAATVYNAQSNFINNCPNMAHIYVPANLVDSYKAAANWSNYANIIEAIPEGV